MKNIKLNHYYHEYQYFYCYISRLFHEKNDLQNISTC